MSLASTYVAPPIWEMALSASTVGGPALNPYNVADLHRQFAGDYPSAERQAPFAGVELFPQEGAPLMQPQITLQMPSQMQPTRWWFVSPEGHRLLQFQDNFLASNWRRLTLPPAVGAPYPGYEEVRSELRRAVEIVSQRNREVKEAPPEPRTVEVLYDNMIPQMRPDGTVTRLSEILTVLDLPQRMRSAFSLGWLEDVDGFSEGGAGISVSIAALGAGITAEQAVNPYARLTFVARAAATSWATAFSFYDAAHNTVHRLLRELITEEVRATWGEQ